MLVGHDDEVHSNRALRWHAVCFIATTNAMKNSVPHSHRMTRRWLSLALLASSAFLPSLAAAQDAWPSRPIKLVVTFPPGGSSDLVARLIAPRLSAALGQPVVIENRPGGAGIIGSDAVAKAAPNGYTLVVSSPGSHSIAPTLNRNIKYDALADFTHVAMIGSIPHVLLANPKFEAQDVKTLVALARKQPGKFDFGSGGTGSINHVIGELFKSKASISLTHIPYKGSAAAIIDLRGNMVPLAVDALPANVGSIRNGDVRALAITSTRRSPLTPDIPTFVELGYPEVIAENWVGLSAPARLPEPIARRLALETEKVIAQPDVQAKLNERGMIPAYRGPTDFTSFVRADIARWKPVIISSGAQID